MNKIRSILTALAKPFKSVFNRFEGASGNWGNRRWLNTSYQDGRFEVDRASTMEMCRKSIYFCENNAFVIRIKQLFVQFAVSIDGLQVIPDCQDPKMDKKALEDWNRDRAERWEKWARSPDLGSNLNFGQLTILWENQLFQVGNIIVLKTQDENGELRLQTIDRLRLSTPPQYASEEGKTIFQGIKLKKIAIKERVLMPDGTISNRMRDLVTGKPELYYIQDEFEAGKYMEVPADQVIHKYHCEMPNQMVGIPRVSGAINTIHDMEDLHILEMGAAKIAASIATVENNATGEVQTNTARSTRLQIQSQNAAGQAVNKNLPYDYTVSLGAQKFGLFQNDKLSNFMVERPTIAQQEYWDFLVNQVCMACGVPRLLVTPYSLQGTVTRADLAVAKDSFLRDFTLVSETAREIYEWWSERDVRYNPNNYRNKPPADYNACDIAPPDSPDVDIGYSAQAEATAMELGSTNLAQVLGRKKINWRRFIRQTAQIQQAINEEAKAYGIKPEDISFKLPSVTAQPEDSGDTQTKTKPQEKEA